MANEFKHADVGGGLTEAEYDSVTGHQFASQATGDIMYASSSSQLSRLGVGATGAVLTVTGGVPVWDTTWTPTGHVIPGTDGAYDLGSSALGFNDLHLGSGGIINLDGGDVTLTHSAGTLTYGGDGAVSVAFGANVDLQFTGGTGTNEIVLANGLADALSITDGSADVIAISTAGGTNTVAITGDLTVSGTIAADTAAVATTVTITDNEDTNEANAIIFTSGGDVDGGNIGLESDGTLNYNPSTGTLTSTVFAGNLSGTVSTGTQGSITAAANLVTVGTIGSGTWQGTAIASAYIAADAITGAKIADNAIDSEHYTDGSIDNAHIADDAIDSEHYAAGSIDTAHIADDQVTLAKMAGLTRGSMIIGDSSGNPAALAKGSANYVLTSDGTDIAWAAAAGDITGVTAGTGLSGGGTSGGVTLNVDAAQTQITSVGALGTGSISSGFGNIDNGSSTLDTGAITATTIAPTDDITLAADKSLNLPQGANVKFTDPITQDSIDDHDAQGIIMTFTAGMTVTPFSPVYLHTDDEVHECDADAIATMPCIGVSVNTSNVADGAAIEVMLLGLIRDESFTDFGTNGAPVYVSTTVGEMTNTAPSGSSDVVQVVGHSIGEKLLFVQPSLTTVEIA